MNEGKVLRHLYQFRIEVSDWGILLTNHAEYAVARLQQLWPGIRLRVSGQLQCATVVEEAEGGEDVQSDGGVVDIEARSSRNDSHDSQ
jgi:hypothetical protein